MGSKNDSLRKKKEKRKKARRQGTATEQEQARRKKQSDEDQGMEEESEESELTSSEEYEDKALKSLEEGNAEIASVYAQLCVAATFREASFIFAEILDPEAKDDDDDDADKQ